MIVAECVLPLAPARSFLSRLSNMTTTEAVAHVFDVCVLSRMTCVWSIHSSPSLFFTAEWVSALSAEGAPTRRLRMLFSHPPGVKLPIAASIAGADGMPSINVLTTICVTPRNSTIAEVGPVANTPNDHNDGPNSGSWSYPTDGGCWLLLYGQPLVKCLSCRSASHRRRVSHTPSRRSQTKVWDSFFDAWISRITQPSNHI